MYKEFGVRLRAGNFNIEIEESTLMQTCLSFCEDDLNNIKIKRYDVTDETTFCKRPFSKPISDDGINLVVTLNKA